jgi:hypothetical protein
VTRDKITSNFTAAPESEQDPPALIHYDLACLALALAVWVDEVKDILDTAVAMRAYAR